MGKRGITSDMPADCVLIQAKLIREGDTVRFRNPNYDYTVEVAELDRRGHVRHRYKDDTGYSSYHPGELLWITRRVLD